MLCDLHTHLLGMGTAKDWFEIVETLVRPPPDSAVAVGAEAEADADLDCDFVYDPRFYGPVVSATESVVLRVEGVDFSSSGSTAPTRLVAFARWKDSLKSSDFWRKVGVEAVLLDAV
jgi:hypothetical protein